MPVLAGSLPSYRSQTTARQNSLGTSQYMPTIGLAWELPTLMASEGEPQKSPVDVVGNLTAIPAQLIIIPGAVPTNALSDLTHSPLC